MEWRKRRILTLPGFPSAQELDHFYGYFEPLSYAEELKVAKEMALSSVRSKW